MKGTLVAGDTEAPAGRMLADAERDASARQHAAEATERIRHGAPTGTSGTVGSE